MAYSSNNTNHIMNGKMSSSSNALLASYPVAATTSSSSTTLFERPTFDNKVPDDLFDEQSWIAKSTTTQAHTCTSVCSLLDKDGFF